MAAAARPRSMNQGGENPEYIVRDFTHGMHNFAAREAIGDEEFWWCENAIPLAGGNLQMVPGPSAALAQSSTESGKIPGYVMGFNINGTPYLFVAFDAAGQTGNAYIVNLNTLVVTQIITGLLALTSSTYATQYGNLGILIIDPNGYWDYNVTTAATLTPWNNSLTGLVLTYSTSFAGNATVTNTGYGGTGGSVVVQYQAVSVVVNAGGGGYVVGDVLTLTDGTPTTATSIIVTAVGGGGAITGISFISQGVYTGPVEGSNLAVGPSGTAVSGGTGTLATFTVKMRAIQGQVGVVTAPGHGYVQGTVSDDKVGATIVSAFTINTSGVIGGSSIATYAARVWIGSGRTVYFTEVGSYSFFGGSGSFFTITDAYLYNVITCLFSANNYLYIFGPTSIDALSNVTVIAGVAAFSRINIVQGIGTTAPTSVFGYYRGVCFYDPSGFYILTGASPEKISEKITNLVGRNALGAFPNAVYGGVMNFRQELCACFTFAFADNVSQLGVTRTVTAIFFRRRWWFYSSGLGNAGNVVAPPVISTINPNTNLPTLYGIGVVTPGTVWGVYQLLFTASPQANWQVKTRFWDSHAPFHIKQAINAAIAGNFLGGASSGITATVDTDLGSSAAVAMPVAGSPNGYRLIVQQVNQGGGQYLGLTVSGNGNDTSQINLFALRAKQEGNLLE
jgi:hypothetical protein